MTTYEKRLAVETHVRPDWARSLWVIEHRVIADDGQVFDHALDELHMDLFAASEVEERAWSERSAMTAVWLPSAL